MANSLKHPWMVDCSVALDAGDSTETIMDNDLNVDIYCEALFQDVIIDIPYSLADYIVKIHNASLSPEGDESNG